MAKRQKLDIPWDIVDEAAWLSKEQVKMLSAFRETMAKANELKKAFNTSFIATVEKAGQIPEGKVALISHSDWKDEFKIGFAEPTKKAGSSGGTFSPKKK